MIKKRVLVGVTGSVAAVKVPEIVVELDARGLEVQLIVTKAGLYFMEQSKDYNSQVWQAYEAIQNKIRIWKDEDDWATWKKMGDEVLHIKLRNWADFYLIAPLSANTMAKLASGLCDNLVTCVARAWDLSKPFVIAPAMNTMMWKHPLTERHLNALQEFRIQIIHPISKTLACGDTGKGALAGVEDIVSWVQNHLSNLE